MNIDVGCGGGVYSTITRAEITVSIDYPNPKPPYFVLADAHHLPFRASLFDDCYAFNLLEHVENPIQVFQEMKRISKRIILRQDTIFNLANYATPEHLWFQLPNVKFIKYPRTSIGIFISKQFRFILMKLLPKYDKHLIIIRFLKFFLPPHQQYTVIQNVI